MRDALVPCPSCRCPSSVSMRVVDGRILMDHDCPSCGHRGLGESDVLLGALRHMALAERVRELAEARPDLAVPLAAAIEGSDEEELYRTRAGEWYGIGTGRRFRLEKVPEGECDRFDPRFDHYYEGAIE